MTLLFLPTCDSVIIYLVIYLFAHAQKMISRDAWQNAKDHFAWTSLELLPNFDPIKKLCKILLRG